MKTLLAVLLLLVAATGNVSAFELSWNDNSTNEEGFKVYRKKAAEADYFLLATTAANVTSFSDPDRTAGNCYRVTAFAALESAPLEACAQAPNGPTILILK